MNEPWFDPGTLDAIIGTTLGLAGGLEGTLAGCLAYRGKCRGLVLGLHFLVMAACSGLLITGLVAWGMGQPCGVYHGFGYPGLLGLVIFGALTPMLFKRYRDAEMRRSIARDL